MPHLRENLCRTLGSSFPMNGLSSDLKHYAAASSPSTRNSVSARVNLVEPRSKQTTSFGNTRSLACPDLSIRENGCSSLCQTLASFGTIVSTDHNRLLRSLEPRCSFCFSDSRRTHSPYRRGITGSNMREPNRSQPLSVFPSQNSDLRLTLSVPMRCKEPP